MGTNDKSLINAKYTLGKNENVCYKKCKSCKYSSKAACSVVINGKLEKIYECNYFLIEGKMRNSDPEFCDKYKRKIYGGSYKMVPMKFGYEYKK